MMNEQQLFPVWSPAGYQASSPESAGLTDIPPGSDHLPLTASF